MWIVCYCNFYCCDIVLSKVKKQISPISACRILWLISDNFTTFDRDFGHSSPPEVKIKLYHVTFELIFDKWKVVVPHWKFNFIELLKKKSSQQTMFAKKCLLAWVRSDITLLLFIGMFIVYPAPCEKQTIHFGFSLSTRRHRFSGVSRIFLEFWKRTV